MQPCGTFSRTYAQDKAIVRTRLQWGLLIAFLILLFAVPSLIGTRVILGFINLSVLNMMGVYIIAVLGLQILMGQCGQVNLGQTAFMGVGAFFCAAFARTWDLNFVLCILIGGLGAAAYGLVWALPAARIKGFYIALTTIAALYVFTIVFPRLPDSWFGGASGMHMPPARMAGVQIVTSEGLYYLIFALVVVFTFFAVNISRSKIGRAFTAIRDNDLAAEVMGVNVFAYKSLAFAICAFYAGVAGSLWAYITLFVNPEPFTFFQSIWMCGMVIVGGMGSILGGILGVVFLKGLEELVSAYGPQLASALSGVGAGVVFAAMNVLIGLIIILFLIFEPRGLAHRWEVLKANYRLWPFPY